jgi:DNA polymerase elongation subunit (family B)
LDITARNILIFDIETVGDNFDEMPEETRTYLTRYADTEEKRMAVIDSLSFNALTSSLAAVGMMDYKTRKGCVMVNAEPGIQLANNYENFNYLIMSEYEIIRKFWEIIAAKEYNLFVTFNGRDFDCPFIMMRSIYHKIKPGYNLMRGGEYGFRDYHIDLMKELSFFSHSGKGGARRKFTLNFYCQKFNIKSPKSGGISGEMVGSLFLDKKYQEIADYCIGDVIAESDLFTFWNEYFNI